MELNYRAGRLEPVCVDIRTGLCSASRITTGKSFGAASRASRNSMPTPKRAPSNIPSGSPCCLNMRLRCDVRSASRREHEPRAFASQPPSKMLIIVPPAVTTVLFSASSPPANGSARATTSSSQGRAARARSRERPRQAYLGASPRRFCRMRILNWLFLPHFL
jgi:hypothetical protein